MNNRIAFQLTDRERDALLTLDVFPAAWPTFEGRTWQALVNKGLVTRNPKPALSPKGKAFVLFTRVPGTFTSHSATDSQSNTRAAAPALRRARACASETLGTLGKSKAAEES